MGRTAIVVAAMCSTALAGTGMCQSYDPSNGSPLSLVAAPADPLAYYEAKERARLLASQNRAAEAEPLAEQITRDYPRDGENWLLLAQIKGSLNKHLESAAAYQRAGPLLWWGSSEDIAFEAAVQFLRADEQTAALEMLRLHLTHSGTMSRTWLYDHEALVSLRSDPAFLEIAGRPDTSGWSRDFGWRRDLDFLRDEVMRLNADYRNGPMPEDFERRYQELRERIRRVSDEEIFVDMNRMLAVLRQGHTSIYNGSEGILPYRGLRLQMYLFPEGVFVVRADRRYQHLVGARVVSIEGVPVEEALRRINGTQSVDGDNQFIFQGMNFLHSLAYLRGLGIAKSSEDVNLVVQSVNEPAQAVSVVPVEAQTFYDVSRLVQVQGKETPLFLQNPNEAHWHQPLPDQKALYIQLNSVGNGPDETLLQFAGRMRSLIAESNVQNVILDMRLNPGGSTNNPGYAELLRTMIGFTTLPDRRLYVLIGRRTYSAAGNLITQLEQDASAIFVGEPSSECCTFYGSPSAIYLPYSKLAGQIATKRWSLSRRGDDFRREMSPHVPVVVSAEQYFAARDPVLETTLSMIERGRPTSAVEEGS